MKTARKIREMMANKETPTLHSIRVIERAIEDAVDENKMSISVKITTHNDIDVLLTILTSHGYNVSIAEISGDTARFKINWNFV